MTDRAEDPFRRCARCGTELSPGVKYPVTTRYDDEGDFSLYSFCDTDCQAAWEDEEGVADEFGNGPSKDAGD